MGFALCLAPECAVDDLKILLSSASAVLGNSPVKIALEIAAHFRKTPTRFEIRSHFGKQKIAVLPDCWISCYITIGGE